MKKLISLLVFLVIPVILLAVNSPVYSTSDNVPLGPADGRHTRGSGGGGRRFIPCLGGYGQLKHIVEGSLVVFLNGAPDNGEPLIAPNFTVDVGWTPEDSSLPTYAGQAVLRFVKVGYLLSDRNYELQDGRILYEFPFDSVDLVGSDGSNVKLDGRIFWIQAFVDDGKIKLGGIGGSGSGFPFTCQ